LPEVWSVLDNETKQVTFPYGGDAAMECLDSHGGWLASSEDLVKFAAALSRTGGGATLLNLGDGVIFACVFNHLPDNMNGYFGEINKTFVPLIKDATKQQHQHLI
jgi:hypothetical protein